jgi:hypothetical protein
MAKVNLVDKRAKLNLWDVIRFQLITHCYLNRITLSDLDYDCLTNLGIQGEPDLASFCSSMAQKRLEEKLKTWKPREKGEPSPTLSPQTIRNTLIRLEKEKLVYKNGNSRKRISLHPDLKIQTKGNILLDYKFVHIGTQEA